MDIDTTAPVITRDEIFVPASIQGVWDVQTHIADWPRWQTDVTVHESPTHLVPGAQFRWHVSGLDIVSTIHEVEPPRRIVWGGPAAGITAVHVWELTPVEGGVVVRTRESWAGPAVDADPPTMQAALDASLAEWLDNLRAAATRSGH
ncbi:SRPBCC family protein [Phycicoccus sp. BSK3Z-2]|uniref:SRPBCC family protein n=1 Tax=Phycicoccus avicenniae TaxID=2828860 RepID=A0A941D7A8_9MICO|nr:SRPBCC family protein [Phycicoccus avicenniae]MBR7741842.1 SRPBCC family protein [Phycicoccus avicenniae]